MGFVRMVRAGGLRATTAAVQFVPDLADIPKFSELVGAELCRDSNSTRGSPTTSASTALDSALANLSSSFTSTNEYFRLLVQVFSGQLSEAKQTHLRNFYLIIPPLTVNYTEHITAAKEKMFKKNIDGAAFTEDGFAIGLAYCLTLLDQVI